MVRAAPNANASSLPLNHRARIALCATINASDPVPMAIMPAIA